MVTLYAGKAIYAIPPFIKAKGFIVIYRDIGGISEINRVTAVIPIAVIINDDPINRDLVCIVSEYAYITEG